MDNFSFYNPTKIIFGKNTIPSIGREIKRNNIDKVLILAGSGSIRNNGVYDAVTTSLIDNKIQYTEQWGVRPNPTLDHANETIEHTRINKIQAILAVGGGSVIDEAKSIACGFYLDNLWDAFERKVAIANALPIFTVLTLSGTCSEMDSFAVLSNQTENKKWPIGSELLFPKVSIIDPSVQMSLPWHQTVNGAIDAMSHIMEFYFLGTNQEITLSTDEAMLRTLISSLDQLAINPKDYNARANIAWAATLALNGISGIALNGGDWSTHRMEHALSAFHPEIAHGAGLAVMFPAWIEYNKKFNRDHFNRWAKNVWDADSPETALIAMKEKYQNWGAPVTLRELGIKKEEIPSLVKNTFSNGPIGALAALSFTDVANIFETAY
ncbi:MAG: iron-containing alcohol dehydrogenase [Candidatus Kapabacteria bacterium]|nr:iron-containing alcohol dehydrogenase [Candidatus Kapabacteria bacterium]